MRTGVAIILALAVSGFGQNPQLSVDQVIAMSQAALPEDVIVARIKSQATPLQVNTDDLIKLKKAGVSDGIIRAISSPGSTASLPSAVATPSSNPTATLAPDTAKVHEPDASEKVYLLNSLDRSLKILPEAPAKVVTHHKGITGAAGAIQISGPTSSFRVKGGADLEFVVKSANPGGFELYAFPTKGENREATVSQAKAGLIHGVSSQATGKLPVAMSKYGDSSYRLLVKAPESGEYGFAVGWSVFHFGVDAK